MQRRTKSFATQTHSDITDITKNRFRYSYI